MQEYKKQVIWSHHQGSEKNTSPLFMGSRSYVHLHQFNTQYTWLYLKLPRLVPKQWGQVPVIQRS